MHWLPRALWDPRPKVLQIVRFDIENILFYVNGAFGKEVPQRACTFCPFQELYTHVFCKIGCCYADHPRGSVRCRPPLGLSEKLERGSTPFTGKVHYQDRKVSFWKFSKRTLLFGKNVLLCRMVKKYKISGGLFNHGY